MKYCQSCGTLLEENAKFCQSCGAPIGETEPVPQVVARAEETTTPKSESSVGQEIKNWDEIKQEFKKAVKEGNEAEAADFKKNPLWYIFDVFCFWLLLLWFLYSVPELPKSKS